MDGLVLEVAAFLQQLEQMPGNGSPSRSGSLRDRACRLSSAPSRWPQRVLVRSITRYFMAKPCSGSTRLLRTRSRTWHRSQHLEILAEVFLMVFAFAGDSTMTRFQPYLCACRKQTGIGGLRLAQCAALVSGSKTSVSMRAQACSGQLAGEHISTIQRICSRLRSSTSTPAAGR